MAKTELTNEQREVIRAQNDALLRLPADLNERLKLFADARVLRARENDQIAQVKKESGLRDHEKRLVEDYCIVPQVLRIMATLAKMPATARAAACRQLIKAIDDEQFVYRDMFDEGAIGQTASDLEGGAVFDKTSEGKRLGGDTAQPRTVDAMKASNVVPMHKPTEALPLDVALQRLEEYRAKNPPKRGAKSKELRDLEASVEAARARDAAADPLAEKPEAQPGEITGALREGAAESEQHIRDAVTGGPSAPPPPAATEKPKRGSGKKAAGAGPAAPPPPAQQAAEDIEDDTVDVGDAPAAVPQRPDAIGSAAASYRAG